MNRIVFVVCGGSFPQIRELEERLGVVSVAAPIFVLGIRSDRSCRELLAVGEILRDLPSVERFSLREFKKEMKALDERKWGGKTTFHQSKGSFAEDTRRKIPWRRNARNR